MKHDETRVPDWLIERLALGELDEPRATELRARLAAEPGGLSRLQAIETSNREILEQYPAAEVARAVERRLQASARIEHARAQGRTGMRWPMFALPLAAGAVAALVLVAKPAVTPGGDTASTKAVVAQTELEETNLKGIKPHLKLFRRQNGKVHQLRDGNAARARDVLQLAYVAAGKQYGAVLSIDGSGQVTWHLPENPGVAELKGGGAVTLPHSYELDEAPGFERFVFVTSDQPFAPERAVEALRSGTAGAGIDAHTFTLRKEPQP